MDEIGLGKIGSDSQDKVLLCITEWLSRLCRPYKMIIICAHQKGMILLHISTFIYSRVPLHVLNLFSNSITLLIILIYLHY